MKKFVLCLGLLEAAFLCYAGGIQFENVSFEEAKAMAKKQNKSIFVDFYADWCGPCKWMDKYIFTDADVAAYFNKNFIAMKVDTDTGKERALINQLNFDAIPTYGFFDSSGSLLMTKSGSMGKEPFLRLASSIVEWDPNEKFDLNTMENKVDKLKILSKKDSEKAQRLISDYISKKIAEDPFFKSASEEDWEIMSEFVAKDWITESWASPTAYLDEIDLHMLNNIEKILEHSYNSSLTEYYDKTFSFMFSYIVETEEKEKMEDYNKANGIYNWVSEEKMSSPESFHGYNWMMYHLKKGNTEYFFKNYGSWLTKHHPENANKRISIGVLLYNNCRSDECLKKTEEIFLDARKKEDNAYTNVILADFYNRTNQDQKLQPILARAAKDWKDSDYYGYFARMSK